MPFVVDEVIGGHYRLERLVGEGGMGMVWAAIDQRTGERVAIKALKVDAGKESDLVRRFFREARAAAAVHHPNVVRIREVTGSEAGPLIVMDYLEGESLASRLERVSRLGLRELSEIFVGVVSAIGTAHAVGIVHRDLKPDNVFLVKTPSGEEPRVVDFGIAKLTALEGDAKQSGGLTTTGTVLGTPYYMSPEQVFGDKQIDHRSDIWSLGLIAFECLTGRRAVDGDNIGQILKVITTGPLPRLRDAAPSLPADVVDVVDRMISFDRAARPADLREVLDVFRRHATRDAQSFGGATLPLGAKVAVESQPLVSPVADTLAEVVGTAPPATPPGPSPAALTTGGASSFAASGAEPPIRPRRSIVGPAVAAAIVAVGVTGGVAVKATRSASAPPVGEAAVLTVAPAPEPPPMPSANASRITSASGEAQPPRPAASLPRDDRDGKEVRPARPSPQAKAASRPPSAPEPPSAPPTPPSATGAARPLGAPLATTNPYGD